MHIPFIGKKKHDPADISFMEDMRLDLSEFLMRKGFTPEEAVRMSRTMLTAVDKKKLMREVF